MTSPPHLSRRGFLAGAAAVGAGAAACVGAIGSLTGSVLAAASTDLRRDAEAGRGAVSGGTDPGLILVSVQLAGGLDFLETVVPLGHRRYQVLRGAGALDDSNDSDMPELHRLDGEYALNSMPYLAARFGDGDLAIVHGLGWTGSSLSHFDATDMWERGRPDLGTRSGWLGRALRDLGGPDPDPLLGISLGGISASMVDDQWSPVGLRPDVALPWTAEFTAEHRSIAAALHRLEPSIGDDLWARARGSQLDLRGLGARLGPVLGDPSERQARAEQGRLTAELECIADLIAAGVPTRAFHVTHDGYDTHREQRFTLARLLDELDRSIERFHDRLGVDAERVVVATWSEFGRRPSWNGQGTEHGTAGLGLVVGPAVRGGHHGEPPPLDHFDRDGNFIVTTDFRSYLSGLTLGAFGTDPRLVSGGDTEPIELLEV